METNESHSRYRKMIPPLYFIAIACMLLIVLLNILGKTPNRPDQFGLRGLSTMDEGWYTADGKPFESAEIDSLRPDDTNTITICYPLPAAIDQDETIVFRSKNCTVRVLVSGNERYASDVTNAPFYNHSPGTRWNLVSITAADAGAEVRLQITQAYADGRAKVDNFYYGDRAAITLTLIGAKLWGLLFSLLIFFVALVFLCAWVVLNWHRTPKDHSLFWLACFALAAAGWCLLETNLFQLFVPDLRLVQLIDNMMLLLAGLPLYLYMDSVFQAFKFRAVRILCTLDITYILLAPLSQYLGFWDYHQTLNGAVSTYGTVVAIMIFCLTQQQKKIATYAARSDLIFHTFQQIGILLLGLGLLGDLIRYLMVDVLDRAFIIRIGLLCFIVCFGAGNIYQMILLVKKGMEADFISQLAYSDGLTKTGNRTAYLEQLEKLSATHAGDEFALIMFDINNLKWVNDTLGHKTGDELLLICSAILTDALPAPWAVYRIGGDEFVATIHGADVHAAYTIAAARFQLAIDYANDSVDRGYGVSIAHGVAFSTSITKETIEAAERESDLKMYQNKYELKRTEA